jgi:hypothetical protein
MVDVVCRYASRVMKPAESSKKGGKGKMENEGRGKSKIYLTHTCKYHTCKYPLVQLLYANKKDNFLIK